MLAVRGQRCSASAGLRGSSSRRASAHPLSISGLKQSSLAAHLHTHTQTHTHIHTRSIPGSQVLYIVYAGAGDSYLACCTYLPSQQPARWPASPACCPAHSLAHPRPLTHSSSTRSSRPRQHNKAGPAPTSALNPASPVAFLPSLISQFHPFCLRQSPTLFYSSLVQLLYRLYLNGVVVAASVYNPCWCQLLLRSLPQPFLPAPLSLLAPFPS
ncbi:hypothetical protein F5B21DRAFT_221047 [Xylaria acuta]|nr:hypothetical protein F5B21DRAFT_221047 [Xylaria acuta]